MITMPTQIHIKDYILQLQMPNTQLQQDMQQQQAIVIMLNMVDIVQE